MSVISDEYKYHRDQEIVDHGRSFIYICHKAMATPIKETVTIGTLQLNFLLDGDDTNNTLVMFELIVLPNAKVPAPHFHVGVDEVLYGLEGTLTQLIGTITLELKAGDKCFIPRGTVHGFTNN